MSSAVQRYAEILSKAVLEFFDERNGLRSIQGLEPLHRVTDEHVAEAGRRLNGNG